MRLLCLLFVLVATGCSGEQKPTETPDQKTLADSQEATAKAQLKQIETAVMGYYTRHQAFPASLAELTQAVDGAKPDLKREDTVDPWGQAFLYEPNVVSKTGAPRISTPGVPGRNKPLANW